MTRVLIALRVVCLVLLCASLGLAQLPTGTILGVVKDSSGAVVPTATVTIRNADTNQARTVTTGDDGAFRVPALAVGNYTVRVEKSGFNTETQTGLTLEVTQELVVNSTLQVGTSTQEVMVTGEAPVVNTTTSSLGGLVNEERVADLPLNGRNWIDLTLLQPGITHYNVPAGGSPVATLGTWFTSNGATTHSNNFMLDGAMMVNIQGANQSSVSNSSLGVDGIREYKVETNSFSADYGLFMGSQTTIVSKSGSNSWHGSAFEYIRNSAMDAANTFDTPASSGLTAAGAQRRLPPFKRNNFGGSFGGPIIKDKTFFFAVYEGVQERTGLTQSGNALGDGTHNTLNCRVLVANPCAGGANVNAFIAPLLGNVPGTSSPFFVLPTSNASGASPLATAPFVFGYIRPVHENYGQFRLDHTFSGKDSAFARYTIDVANVTQPNQGAPNPNLIDHLSSGTQFLTVSETHIFSGSLLNTARFSDSRTPQENGNQPPAYPVCAGATTCSFIPGRPATLGMGNVSMGSTVTAFTAGIPAHHDQKVYAVSDDIFYTKGKHALKFGTLITNWKQRMELQNALRGSLSFNSIPNFLTANFADTSQSYSGTAPNSNIQRNFTFGTLGVYVQDDIRVTPRLTLNAGLRYEFQIPTLHEVSGIQSNLVNLSDSISTVGPELMNRTRKAFSPRLGFAWDVFGDGKTSLRGGGALLWDLGGIAPVLYRSAGSLPPFAAQDQVTGPTSGACITAAGSFQIPFSFPACSVGKTLTLPQYNMRPAHLLVYNLTVERQLPWGMGLSVGYAGSRGMSLINITEGNPIPPTATVNGSPEWQPFLCNGAASTTKCAVGVTQTANPAYVRINPNWASMTLMGSSSDSWYNSLQTVLTKRISHGLQFQSSYTWAKNLDDGAGFGAADASSASWDPRNSRNMRSPAVYDVAHNLRFNAIYHLPKFSQNGFVGGFVNGWWGSSIVSFNTGYPFSVSDNSNQSLSGVLTSNSDLANIDPTRSLYSITNGVSSGCGSGATQIVAGTPLHTTARWYDPCAFSVQPPGFLGNAGRNILRGPRTSDVDMSLGKDTRLKYLGEAGQVQFRAEFFNIFNHPNFGQPTGTAFNTTTGQPQANAGQIQITTVKNRQVQLALKVVF